MDCDDGSDDHENDFKNGKSCRFDYKKVFANSECNEENNYGFNTEKPCILVKVNKIISWKPANKTIEIKCQGEVIIIFFEKKNQILIRLIRFFFCLK